MAKNEARLTRNLIVKLPTITRGAIRLLERNNLKRGKEGGGLGTRLLHALDDIPSITPSTLMLLGGFGVQMKEKGKPTLLHRGIA